jgi:poly(3-hydroxybutyrate) depolymerase
VTRPGSRAVRWAWLAILVLVAALVRGRARADDGGTSATGKPVVLKDRPCAGCLMSLPAGQEPVPLLVLLHGDGQSASVLFAKWQRHAAARGIAVLALACPRSDGCGASWWRWNGPPSWIRDQIAALALVRAIDPTRLWLAGWSGGATYAGYHTQELEKTFAAFVVHGGGMRPDDPSCGTEPTSAYFVEGTLNPFHAHAVWLKEHYEACSADVVWVVLKGADHDKEWAALDTPRAAAILDWLATKRHAALRDAGSVGVDPLDAQATDARSPPLVEPQTAEDARAPDTTAGPSLPPQRDCRCGTPGQPGGAGQDALSWALALGAVTSRRLRRRGAASRLCPSRDGAGGSSPLPRARPRAPGRSSRRKP